ncbi:GDYXXLXY domain-containing protein [Roseibium sp.]|uniref:GDYXXLXY domain-containing protein n=1 Tax=Roseibium sp. TaxID=1936156 RepID=UPI003A97EF7A
MTRGPLLRSPWARWGLLAVIQLGLIAVPFADRLEVQMTGEEIPLATRPVDPRDLLRGDYVVINLDIRQIPEAAAASFGKPVAGETVFVGLRADADGVYRAVSVAKTRDLAGETAIKGTITSVASTPDAVLTVDYGIDAFYLAEGKGKEIERLDASRVQLVVSLAPDGRSVPLRLLIDGKPFKSDAAF